MTDIQLKRAYESPSPDDGYRVLVDRLWPRGLTHQQLPYDLWAKDLAPSDQLREWFHQDRAARWEEFEKRYADELSHSAAMQSFVRLIAAKPKVTLIYGSRDTVHNQADVIKQVATTLLSKT